MAGIITPGDKYLAVVINKRRNISILIPPFMSAVFAGNIMGWGSPKGGRLIVFITHRVARVACDPQDARLCVPHQANITPVQSALKCKPLTRLAPDASGRKSS